MTDALSHIRVDDTTHASSAVGSCPHQIMLMYYYVHSRMGYAPKDWRRPPGRPRTTWLPMVKSDLQSVCEYWSVLCLVTSSGPLYMEAYRGDSREVYCMIYGHWFDITLLWYSKWSHHPEPCSSVGTGL